MRIQQVLLIRGIYRSIEVSPDAPQGIHVSIHPIGNSVMISAVCWVQASRKKGLQVHQLLLLKAGDPDTGFICGSSMSRRV